MRVFKRVGAWCLFSVAALSNMACLSPRTERQLKAADAAALRVDPSRAPGRTAIAGASTAATAPSADVATTALDRETVVALAVSRNPELESMVHRARALVHAGRAEGALPAAEVEVAVWNAPLARPYAVGEADMIMVNLQQRFPPAGSLDGEAHAMAAEAQAMLAELSSAERATARQATVAFVNYVQSFSELRLLSEQRAVLERLQQALQARYATGGSGLLDLARLDVEMAQLERAAIRAEGETQIARATLNALLRRAPEAELAEPREVRAETVALDLEELLARAQSQRGNAVAGEARVRAASARLDAAEAEARVPEFMVGVGYWQDPSMRPGIGVSAGMSLPWLWGPQHERIAQAREQQVAERAARDSVGVMTRAEVGEAFARMAALGRQLQSVHERALPSLRRSRDAISATLVTSNTSLLEWLDVSRSTLELEMEALELQRELALSIADLEQAVGTPLPRIPLKLESGS
jgi:outer membrane protein, heavy metal efflux system